MYRYSIIKSIQRGTITVATSASSGTATISSVVTAASVVQMLSYPTAAGSGNTDIGTNAQKVFVRLELTNATTVTATLAAAIADTRLVNFEVWEYYPSVLTANGVQRGTISMNNVTSATATITGVSAKAGLVAGGFSLNFNTSLAGFGSLDYPKIVLTNSTTVTATLGELLGANVLIAPYQVVDIK